MQMRQQRLSKQASAARDRPTAASLAAWAEMQEGTAEGQRYCLRFRLQPWSENGALRDPVAYRVILEPHYKKGEHKVHVKVQS
jgi:glutamyl-tRNA synthetase